MSSSDNRKCRVNASMISSLIRFLIVHTLLFPFEMQRNHFTHKYRVKISSEIFQYFSYTRFSYLTIPREEYRVGNCVSQTLRDPRLLNSIADWQID